MYNYDHWRCGPSARAILIAFGDLVYETIQVRVSYRNTFCGTFRMESLRTEPFKDPDTSMDSIPLLPSQDAYHG